MIQSKQHLEAMYSFDFDDFEKEGFRQQVHVKDTFVFLYVHCLPSFEKLIAFMIERYGFLPQSIFVLPKRYSRIRSSLNRLKELNVNVIDSEFSFRIGYFDQAADREILRACKDVMAKISAKQKNKGQKKGRVILVDDGGQLTRVWQKLNGRNGGIETVSVQQTASGLFDKKFTFDIPQINMAQSAAKRWFESRIIATGVAQKVADLDHDLSDALITRRMGIAGFGAVGHALAKMLVEAGHEIVVLDPIKRPQIDELGLEYHQDQCDFLRSVQTVFGCVGRDWLENDAIGCIRRRILFFSCSSRDLEFRRILREFQPDCIDPPFGTLRFSELHESRVYNGGFPINFDRTKEYEATNEIIITRALVLASVLQGMCMDTTFSNQPFKLATVAQRNVVFEWLSENGSVDELEGKFGVSKENFSDDNWWLDNSQGLSYSDRRTLKAQSGYLM